MNPKSKSQDRRLASSESHEIRFAENKIGDGGKNAAVVVATKRPERITSKERMMALASAMAGHPLENEGRRTG